ncbi:MAG: 3-keto-disaccharide hydrolase [Thermoguttaceae bacterium]
MLHLSKLSCFLVVLFGITSAQTEAAQHNVFGAKRLPFRVKSAPKQYVLSAAEPLFPNNSLDNWMRPDGSMPGKGWVFEEDVLVRKSGAGDIITKKEYEYFVLEFDWAIEQGCNSGVKYRLKKFDNNWLGCEFQILDDAAVGKWDMNPKNMTGSLYDVYAPDETKKVQPIGEFNHAKIVVFGNKIEHWLNDSKILTVHTGSRDWQDKIAKSKFNEAPGFGENRFGRILFQDHGGVVRFKNVTISEYVAQ